MNRAQLIYDVSVTLALDHPRLLELLKLIRAAAVPEQVPMAPKLLPHGNCYWNVDRVIRENGGEMVLGWQLTEWPGRCLTAMHHAVWSPQGRVLQDVTAKSPTDRGEPFSVFVRDATILVSLDKAPNVKSKRVALDNSPLTAAFLRAYEDKHAAEQRLGDLAYALGYRCESERATAVGGTPGPSRFTAAPNAVALLQQLFSQAAATRNALGAAIKALREADAAA